MEIFLWLRKKLKIIYIRRGGRLKQCMFESWGKRNKLGVCTFSTYIRLSTLSLATAAIKSAEHILVKEQLRDVSLLISTVIYERWELQRHFKNG
jgi:hypothetical protein